MKLRIHQQGLTLIELMVTLAVAAILVGVAIPNLSTLYRNNLLSSNANDLAHSLNFARSEAITRGASVTVESLDSDGDWNKGWKISSNGTDIRVLQVANSGGILIGTNAVGSAITFTSNGNTTGGASFTLCDSGDIDDFAAKSSRVRLITVALSGRVSSMTANDGRNVSVTECLS